MSGQRNMSWMFLWECANILEKETDCIPKRKGRKYMQAKETEFGFMAASMSIEIPYFQRGYVWNEENWEELLDNLLDDNESHFLGSIILKQLECVSGNVPRWSVIDGQQRLTTLSILLRACYDTLPMDTFPEDVKNDIEVNLASILFYKHRRINSPKEIKIKHSMVDTADYKLIIEGTARQMVENIVLHSKKKKGEKESSNLLQCYKYFYDYLVERPDTSVKLWEDLLDDQNKILVKIDLDISENEQAIFDTVNSAGVRLTCADTIKNALFQKANENAASEPDKEAVIRLYKECWEQVFSANSEVIEYWGTERKLGRTVRDNLEVLLHCVALVKGFFDPELHRLSDLPQVYKKYISGFDNQALFSFIEEIREYAKLYQKYFYTFDKSTFFSYKNDIQRLFHVLSVCEVSTLHPYILKLFKEYEIEDEYRLPEEFKEELRRIEKYVIRHTVCQVSIKNFNKDCALLIAGKATIGKFFHDKEHEIGDEAVKEKLKTIPYNKVASLILFWIELHRKAVDGRFDTQELKYVYSLEHIMPQKWEEYWNFSECPVRSVATKEIITDKELCREIRSAAIYELGNMTLLSSNLNSSIRNYEFDRKVNGEKRKKGIKDYASLDITREVVNVYESEKLWNEVKIRERTNALTEEFLEMW